MKKLLKILIILILIGVLGLCLYKFVFLKSKQNSNKSQFSDLKKYLSDIYGRTFIIPEFDDINEADEQWLWENVNQYVWNHDDEYHEQNSQEYGYSYDDISKIVKILYGDNLDKKFPTGAISMRYDPYRNLYGPTSYGVTNYYNYEIDDISKKDNIYTVSLYDYTISTGLSLKDDAPEDQNYVIFNNYDYLLNSDNGTPIISIASLKDKKFENLLSNQKDKLSHKILTIEFDEPTNLYHIKSCKYQETKPEDILSTIYKEMKTTFDISSIEYDYDEIYISDEVLVKNFDELSSLYTENAINTYKEEMSLLVYKDNGEVYITPGDINIESYLIKTEFKDIEESDDKITATAVRTLREDWYEESEKYNNIYEIENKFTIVKKDNKWYVDEFSYNSNYSNPENN